HIYSSPLDVTTSFAAMTQLAIHPRIKRMEFINLIDTDEKCIEWHAWYLDDVDELWQLDMIHILKGSLYDGYMEKVADGILKQLTPELKQTILQLKYDTPDTEKIMGIEYYKAVISDGVKTYAEFMEWRNVNPANGVIQWMP
ncbi:MAG: hypothetical protein ACRC2T_14040, partial [Thermoguttaceae bacterium]